MHDLSHDPKVPDRRVEGSETENGPPTADGGEHAGQTTETELCTLCDIVNDTYVAPRAFVLSWRLAGDGE